MGPFNKNPKTVILIAASMINKQERILSIESKFYCFFPLGSFRGFSKAKWMHEQTIKNIIKYSVFSDSIISLNLITHLF